MDLKKKKFKNFQVLLGIIIIIFFVTVGFVINAQADPSPAPSSTPDSTPDSTPTPTVEPSPTPDPCPEGQGCSTCNQCGCGDGVCASGSCNAVAPALPANYGNSCTDAAFCSTCNSPCSCPGALGCNDNCVASCQCPVGTCVMSNWSDPAGYDDHLGGTCSAACGGGTQTRVCFGDTCAFNCNGNLTSRNCNTQACCAANNGGICYSAYNNCGNRNSGIYNCAGNCVDANGTTISAPANGVIACYGDTDCQTCYNAGYCSAYYAPKQNGTVCTSDGNLCTTDACSSGTCAHTNVPVSGVCNAWSSWSCSGSNKIRSRTYTAPTCSGTDVTCTPLSETASCADGNDCTTDSCSGGVCSNQVSGSHLACSSNLCASVDNTSSVCTNQSSCTSVGQNCGCAGNYLNSCNSAANDCGNRNSGTYNCAGNCVDANGTAIAAPANVISFANSSALSFCIGNGCTGSNGATIYSSTGINRPGTANLSGVCKKITNTSANSYFIPTKTYTEWSSFYNSPPNGVTPTNCCP